MKCNHIKWTTLRSLHVDADTGETITKHNAAHNYIKIKTNVEKIKNVVLGTGLRQFTHLYRKKPQLELFQNNTNG